MQLEPSKTDRKLSQPDTGYRFSLDPFLLADFVSKDTIESAIDIGTGNGILPALLKKFLPETFFVGMDIRRLPLDHARHNHVQGSFIHADANDLPNLFPPGLFGLVISNPPYRKVGEGRINLDPEKAVARHELKLTFGQLCKVTNHLLMPGGRFCFSHLYERRDELMKTLKEHRLNPQRMRLVQSDITTPPFLVLVEAVKFGTGDLVEEKPAIVYEEDGRYTPNMQAVYDTLKL